MWLCLLTYGKGYANCELVDGGTYGPKMDGSDEGGSISLDLDLEWIISPWEWALGLKSWPLEISLTWKGFDILCALLWDPLLNSAFD